MHDPDERPRFRWRIVLWGLAGLTLTGVVYVAMLGPLSWWAAFHGKSSPVFDKYYYSLDPLRRDPQFGTWLRQYEIWWSTLPPARARQRAELVVRIKQLESELAAMPARIRAAAKKEQAQQETQRAIETLKERAIRAEVAQTIEGRPVTGQPEIQEEIQRLVKSIEPEPGNPLDCRNSNLLDEQRQTQAELAEFQQMLRQFDAR